MAKDIDELLRGVFGNSTQRTISTEKAERYLEQSRRMDAGLDALQKQQTDVNDRLQKQLDELKRLSGELDLDKIQQEVQRDFGVSSEKKEEARTASQQAQDPRPEAQRFSDFLPVLSGQLIGQEAFLKSLLIAFKRPYVTGWDAPNGLRNAMLVYGKPNTGRHTALRLMAEQMTQAGLLPQDGLRIMDLALYPGAAEEKLFLQDLYQALQSGGLLVLDHYESCHPAFLQQLSELICTGKLNLASRYVMQKGHLVDAGTALSSQAVGALQANGCYLVIVSEKGREALAGAFGAKVVDALGDHCQTGPLTQEDLEKIGGIQWDKLRERAEKQLGFTLSAEEGIERFFAGKYSIRSGVGDMLRCADELFRALAQYKLEKDAPAQNVAVSVADGRLFAQLDGARVDVLSLLPGGYRGELEAVKAELDKAVKPVEAEKLDGSKYTAESWKAFETALAHAKAVIASDSATQQDVDAALGALTSARDGLTEKGEVKPDPKPEPGTVDKAALDKAVKKVEAEKLDGSKYTAESWKAFETALAHAKAVIGNANSTQFDIDNALSMLNDARAALKEKPGRIIAIIDGSALSKTGASVAIIASVAAAMLAVGAGVMALRRKRS